MATTRDSLEKALELKVHSTSALAQCSVSTASTWMTDSSAWSVTIRYLSRSLIAAQESLEGSRRGHLSPAQNSGSEYPSKDWPIATG